MGPVFVDTAALIALNNQRDALHQQADRVRRDLVAESRLFLTSSLVLVELCNAFSRVALRPTALSTLDSIQASDRWSCIHVNETLLERGLKRFRERPDKEWSLVDCVSMVLAVDFGCTEVFTSDYHFAQAGFTTLLQV